MKYREILEACWKGYQKKGMKTMFGKRYPNCVKKTNEELEEDLKKWFKEKWVRFGPDGKIRGDCARGDDSEGKPKCLPQSKAHALGKKGRASAAAKKRREDPNPERRGAAKNVATRVREAGVNKKPQPYNDPEWIKKLTPAERSKLAGPKYKKDKTPKVSEDEIKDLEKILKNPTSYDAIDHMMQSIAKKSKITAKQLHDRFVAKHNKTPDDWIKNKGA
jgi:hypothetical protein